MTLERLDAETTGDRFAAELHRNIYDFVLSRLSPGQKVLEIGTGLGAFSLRIFPRCDSYIGVEYDEMARQAAIKKTGGQAKIIQGDARRLPFDANQFSFVVCLEVIEHLEDWQAGVKEIHRCVGPDGMAIISVPYRRVGGKSKGNEYHLYEPGEGELTSLFGSLFAEVEVYYQYFEETWRMTLARTLHIRRFLGFRGIYADLSAGLPHALSKLHIAAKSGGMNTNLILVARRKK